MDKFYDNHTIEVYYREDFIGCTFHKHSHNSHEIILVVDGEAEFTIGSQQYCAAANSVVFISSLENHYIKVISYPYRRYVITSSHEFSLFFIENPVLLSILLQRPKNFLHTLPLTKATSKVIETHVLQLLCEQEIQDEFWLLTASSIFISMLVQIYRFNSAYFPVRQTSPAVQIVLKVQQEIGEKYNSALSLDDFSKKHFISKYYLCRIFKQVSGYNLKDYIVLHRLNEAKKLLCTSSESVTEIGYRIGYPNVNHFIRIFKKHVGTSPLQYRKLWLQAGIKKPGLY